MKNIDLGVQYMLLASFLFALMGFFVKELSFHMSSTEIVFFRNIFAIFFVLITFFKSPLAQKGGRFWLLVFRGLVGMLALMLHFYNISTMPLADAFTFTKTSPIFTALLAYFFLKERLNPFAWVAVFIGFVGIVLIVRPTGDFSMFHGVTGVLAGLFAAMAYTSIRELRDYYEPRAIVLSFAVVGTIAPVLLLVFGDFFSTTPLKFLVADFVMPDTKMWIYIVLMGALATSSQILMTKSYMLTKAGVASAVSYTNILFALIIGIILLGDPFPDLISTIGIILIVVAGIWVSKK